MKLRLTLLLVCSLFLTSLFAQSDKELAYKKAREAIKLMDEGKFDESIALLKECEKLDPKDYNYPYEIALAYTYQKDYKKAIKKLTKVLKYKGINSQVYQLLGNNYSLSGNETEALKTYAKGLEKFPNAGNLYLETGNIYLFKEDYDKAVQNYEEGIRVEPNYPSNYFRLAKLFLNSSDKLSGLMYGEIFMNLERTTQRTIEMSELLFKTYATSIEFKKGGDEMKMEFCDIVIDAATILDEGELKMPFCGTFGAKFALALVGQSEITLKSLSEIRAKFIEYYFDDEENNNVLFEYHQTMMKEGHFEAYNYYLFQIAETEEFNTWQMENLKAFEAFVDWYTTPSNELILSKKNLFLRD